MVQCFLVESNSLLLKNGSFIFLLFFLSASQMIYTKKKKIITMAINTDAANMQKSNT